MKGQKVLFSHKSDDWETPQDFFTELDKEFHFGIDACATRKNAKCPEYFTRETDGLNKPWGGITVWCNPPYSNIKEWCRKCSEHRGTAVMLVPARTDTAWFHDYCYNKPGVEVRFIRGRLKFGGAKNSAPFPSMLVIFRNGHPGKQHTPTNLPQ